MAARPPSRLRAVPAEAPAVVPLVVGREAGEAAALLPRIFNLCRAAQETGARMALGLDAGAAARALGAEILREHMLKLWVLWPARLGLAARPLPAGWAGDGAVARAALFGGPVPGSGAAMDAFLRSGRGVAPVLSAIAVAFAPGEAASGRLPAPDARTAFERAPLENTVAARHAGHPALDWIEDGFGRGPLWRAVARLLDADAALAGALPAPHPAGEGRALVPAARGLYAVSAHLAEGRVAAFDRVTPTDHLLAAGGIMERALATLADPGRAGLLVEILDPCLPVEIREAADA